MKENEVESVNIALVYDFHEFSPKKLIIILLNFEKRKSLMNVLLCDIIKSRSMLIVNETDKCRVFFMIPPSSVYTGILLTCSSV